MVFIVFQFAPFASCSVTEHHHEETGSIFFPPIRCLHAVVRAPWALSYPRWTVPAPQSVFVRQILQGPNHLCNPFHGPTPVHPCLPCTREPKPVPVFQMHLTCTEQKESITFHSLLVMQRLMQPEWLLVFFATAAELLFNRPYCLGLFLPRSWTLYFTLAKFLRYLPATFSTHQGPSEMQQNHQLYQSLLIIFYLAYQSNYPCASCKVRYFLQNPNNFRKPV